MTDSNRDLGPGVSHLEIAVMGQQEGLGDGFALGEQARLAGAGPDGTGQIVAHGKAPAGEAVGGLQNEPGLGSLKALYGRLLVAERPTPPCP